MEDMEEENNEIMIELSIVNFGAGIINYEELDNFEIRNIITKHVYIELSPKDNSLALSIVSIINELITYVELTMLNTNYNISEVLDLRIGVCIKETTDDFEDIILTESNNPNRAILNYIRCRESGNFIEEFYNKTIYPRIWKISQTMSFRFSRRNKLTYAEYRDLNIILKYELEAICLELYSFYKRYVNENNQSDIEKSVFKQSGISDKIRDIFNNIKEN